MTRTINTERNLAGVKPGEVTKGQYYYLLYQLGTGGCTQKAQLVQGAYP